ncbi:MAG: outer membrane protein assembly factor BamD [Methylococcaceae bacterium]|nr:outer membrane protein assembly factor BamD [Methylococcaceae bacterium]
MRFIFVKILFILFFTLSLQGCETLKSLASSDSDSSDEYIDWESKKFHEEAKKAMAAENYPRAIELFQALESRYPFGEYAAQTQLDIAYAYYKNEDSEAALAAAERFIKINPTNANIDYAYYLKGLINFNRDIGFLYRYVPTDSTQRDPVKFKESYANFEELLRRFPTSQYVDDAKQRMIALRDYLAKYELNVARFYMKRKAYMAAVNRAAKIVEECQAKHPAPCTPVVPYALQIMEEGYRHLGLNDLASNSKRVYEQNYPNGAPIDIDENETFIEDFWDVIGLDED